MADLLHCPGPVGMLAECEHGQRREHHYLQGACNRCGRTVTVLTGRYSRLAEVKGFRCRECMSSEPSRG
jgi:hypothetical protein